MSESYSAESARKFKVLALEEQVRQVKGWIETKPHNEEIIPLGKHCRAADYVDNLNPNYFELLSLAYGDNHNQSQIASFLSQASERELLDSVRKNDAAALPMSICFGSLAG